MIKKYKFTYIKLNFKTIDHNFTYIIVFINKFDDNLL